LRLTDEHLEALLRVSTTKMKADLDKLVGGLGKILNKRCPTLVKLFNVSTF